ncbi:hypothetical protein FA13DRAFT_1735657 [Coprinellus micaceus]|uniref:Uncharacterized protein n=1 Tax=Coprinellus micaceus TaxID=71717 RepID=A0A4Y7T316_COPMI|nr:hypothetical protein FA13DRAFT_1735657 [Coprinellus micaceus]
MALTTDVTPRIHLEPGQVLKDDHRVKRLVAALSEGIFYDIDEKKASEILQECLKICGGSNETLSQVLQDKFFGGHTPFYWAITNKNPQSHTLPLLKELIFYGGVLTKETQGDIVVAFRMYFDSVLYEAVKPALTAVDTLDPYSPSFFHGDEYRPIVTGNATTGIVRFYIPRLFDRLLVDGGLSLQFYALGSTFCLAAVTAGEGVRGRPSWMFTLKELPPSGQGAMQIVADLEIQSQDNSTYSCRYYGYNNYSPRLSQMEIQERELTEFCRNPYTANERGALTGKLTLMG